MKFSSNINSKFNSKFKQLLACVSVVILVTGALTGCMSPKASESVQTEGSQTNVSQNAATKIFVDSTGREVTVPTHIEKIAVSGPLAQMVLYALAPEKMVGIAEKWDKAALPFVPDAYVSLPELGQLYGGKGELNLETLLNSGAQVVIDIGEPKDSIKTDMNALQEKTGMPFIHVTANLDNMGDAYRQLGVLLNKEKEAEVLATYCETTYEKTKELAGQVKKVNALYCVGEKGLNVIAKGSFHAEVIDLLTNNVAAVDKPVSKGTGNAVDMEQILKWNPEVILFAPNSIFATVKDDATWQQLSAIQKGKYYETPDGPYNWLGFPPSVQRYLGMQWLAKVLYPETATENLYDATAHYFKLFYHWDLTRDQYNALVKNPNL